MENTIMQREGFWVTLKIHQIFQISEILLESVFNCPASGVSWNTLSGEKKKVLLFLSSRRMLWFLVSSEQAIKDELFLYSMTNCVRSKYPEQDRDHVWYRGTMQLPQSCTASLRHLSSWRAGLVKLWNLKADLCKDGFWLQTCSVG